MTMSACGSLSGVAQSWTRLKQLGGSSSMWGSNCLCCTFIQQERPQKEVSLYSVSKQRVQTSGTVYRRGSGLTVPASLAGVLLQRKWMHQTMLVWRQELLRPFSNSLCYDSILSFNCTFAFHVAFVQQDNELIGQCKDFSLLDIISSS